MLKIFEGHTLPLGDGDKADSSYKRKVSRFLVKTRSQPISDAETSGEDSRQRRN